MSNLMRSNGGRELCPEICMVIMEHALNANPKVITILLEVSHSFQTLLETYKTSILKTLLLDDARCAYTNASQAKIHASSQMTPGRSTVEKMTYAWASEIRCRIETIDFLVDHELIEMVGPEHRWPCPEGIPKDELEKRTTIFKRDSLGLLYRLSDCAAGLNTKMVIRERQAEFLDKDVSVSELAALGVIVEVMGQGFFNITNNALQESGILNSQGIQFSNLSASALYRPSTIPIQDLNNPHWIRECMCVFEDLVQRYGPCYAYAYVGGWKMDRRKPDFWARLMLQKGLDAMNSYEMGHTMSYASLQSVVWRVFCKKANCSMQGSWDRAKKLVEDRMSEYKLRGAY